MVQTLKKEVVPNHIRHHHVIVVIKKKKNYIKMGVLANVVINKNMKRKRKIY